MAAWPGSLPQEFEIDGAALAPSSQSIGTDMEVGPPKRRRRTSTDVTPFAAAQTLTGTQVATLETFYKTTTNGGADTWTHTHPVTGAAANYQFASRYTIAPMRGFATTATRLWRVRYSLLIVP